MKKRRYPLSLFLIGFLMNILVHNFLLFILSVIFLIIGIWVDWCLYVGLAILTGNIIISFAEQVRIRHTMLTDTDNEEFNRFRDAVLDDGNVFENVRGYVEDNAEEYTGDEKNDLIIQMCDNVCEKCEYGEAIEKLNEHERVFYVTQILEQEVNNGGFSQFFYNSSGDFSNEIVDAFTKIGAFKTAEICKKALAVFNGNVPTDRDAREELLDSLECDDVLSECDDDFYEYEDNLEELNYTYIMEHRSSFD